MCSAGRKPGKRLLGAVLTVSFAASVPFGFSLTVVNIPESIFEQFVNGSYYQSRGLPLGSGELATTWALIVSAFTLGGAIGALLCPWLAESCGRRRGLIPCGVVGILGAFTAALSYTADSFELLALGRIVGGISCGLSSSLLSIYLSEISPTSLRGFSGAFQEVFIVFGKLAGHVLALPYFLGSATRWPYLVAVPIIPGLVLALSMLVLPETPKFIKSRLRSDETDSNEAVLASVRFYHGSNSNFTAVLQEIDDELAIGRQKTTLRQILTNPLLRKCLYLAVVVRLAQELTAVTAIFNYSTEIFETLKLSHDFAMYTTMGLGVVALGVTLMAVGFVERLGRRPLLVYGLACLLCINIVYMVFAGISQHGPWAGYICVALFYTHIVVFSFGPGPISWLVVPELVPQSARSTITSIGVLVNWCSNMVVTALYLPLQERFGSLSFLLFIVPLAVCVAILWKDLPETKGRTIEAISALLMPAGDFEEDSPTLALLAERPDNSDNSTNAVMT